MLGTTPAAHLCLGTMYQNRGGSPCSETNSSDLRLIQAAGAEGLECGTMQYNFQRIVQAAKYLTDVPIGCSHVSWSLASYLLSHLSHLQVIIVMDEAQGVVIGHRLRAVDLRGGRYGRRWVERR